jgi:hypothetical protein
VGTLINIIRSISLSLLAFGRKKESYICLPLKKALSGYFNPFILKSTDKIEKNLAIL